MMLCLKIDELEAKEKQEAFLFIITSSTYSFSEVRTILLLTKYSTTEIDFILFFPKVLYNFLHFIFSFSLQQFMLILLLEEA